MSLEARHARLPNALVAIPCAIASAIFLGALLFGWPDLDVARGGQLAALAIFGSTAIWCGKSALAPSLVCAIDESGVVIGKGIFINKKRRIAWSEVERFEKATLIVENIKTDSRNTYSKHPAIKIHFRQGTNLGSVGYSLGHPDSPDVFIVAAELFRRSQAQLLASVEAMHRRAGG